MGFRFRRSVRIIPGIRLNFSKSGISTSIGGRGATINFSKRGTRTTVGIPGTGLSYSEMVPKADGSPHQAQMPNGGQARSQANGCFALLVIGLVIVLAISIKGIVSSDSAAVRTPPAKVQVENLYVTANHLNCRAAPEKSSRRIAQLARGQMVSAISSDRENGWVNLSVSGQNCWASADHLSDEPR